MSTYTMPGTTSTAPSAEETKAGLAEAHGNSSTIIAASTIVSFLILIIFGLLLFFRITRKLRNRREKKRRNEARLAEQGDEMNTARYTGGRKRGKGRNAFEVTEWEGVPA
ncbi:hypothetical protein JCM21900_004559 [Sporobolomyces salmonicolor]